MFQYKISFGPFNKGSFLIWLLLPSTYKQNTVLQNPNKEGNEKARANLILDLLHEVNMNWKRGTWLFLSGEMSALKTCLYSSSFQFRIKGVGVCSGEKRKTGKKDSGAALFV